MLYYRHSSGLLQSVSPARRRKHDVGHVPPFSFAGLPASHEARMRRCRRRISQAEGSAWLSPPLRFDSELEWCQARAVPVGKTDVKYYSTVFSAKQACRCALTSIEKDFLIFNRRAMHTPAWTRAKPRCRGAHRAPAFILFPYSSRARYRLCTRSARIALSTASTFTPTSAKSAAHMFARPSAPSARQANLTASAKTMF